MLILIKNLQAHDSTLKLLEFNQKNSYFDKQPILLLIISLLRISKIQAVKTILIYFHLIFVILSVLWNLTNYNQKRRIQEEKKQKQLKEEKAYQKQDKLEISYFQMVKHQTILQGVLVTLAIYLASVVILEQKQAQNGILNEKIQNSYEINRNLNNLDDAFTNDSELFQDYYKLFQYHFKGEWNQKSHPNQNDPIGENITVEEQFGFIRRTSGNVFIRFNDLILSDNKMLYIYLYEEGFYDDQRRLLVKIYYEVYRDNNQVTQSNAQVIMIDKMMQVERDDLEINFKSFFYDRNTMEIISPNHLKSFDLEAVNFHIFMTAVSKGRTLSFTSNINIVTESQIFKNLNLCLFSTSIALTCLIGSTFLYNKLKQNESEAKNLSLVTLGYCTVQDAYICLVFLWQALSMNKLFIIYTVPALCYFLLSTVFEMRLTVLAWKEKYYYRFSQQNEVKKGIAIFYSLFYLGLFGFFISVSFFYIYNSFILCLSLVFIPQIICTAINGNSKKFYCSYIFGILLPRIALPLYMRGCPNNIMNFKPSYNFCFLWVTSFVIQILIVFLQSKYGPRFFVPAIFLPKQYNYNFVYQYNPEEKETDDCAICLGALHLDPMEDEPSQETDNIEINLQVKSSLQKQLIKKKKIYKTPCNHLFHKECLHSWIEVKLECPQCRQNLPTCY